MNWNGKSKAFTLSYDDGIASDKRLLEIINAYGLKCTFNLNSALMQEPNSWKIQNDFEVCRMTLADMKDIYQGHEIAVHGSVHRNPEEIQTTEEFEEEFLRDRERLTEFCGVEPVGMAYAYGVYPDHVVEKLREHGFQYGRTVWSSHSFELQQDLLRLRPTCHHEDEKLFELLDRFLAMPENPENPQLFYLWGHSYEFDGNRNWDRLERVCKLIAGRSNIFYGTNREVLL